MDQQHLEAHRIRSGATPVDDQACTVGGHGTPMVLWWAQQDSNL